jgi:hypothetical protein
MALTHAEIFFNFGASNRKLTETPCFFLSHITSLKLMLIQKLIHNFSGSGRGAKPKWV